MKKLIFRSEKEQKVFSVSAFFDVDVSAFDVAMVTKPEYFDGTTTKKKTASKSKMKSNQQDMETQRLEETKS